MTILTSFLALFIPPESSPRFLFRFFSTFFIFFLNLLFSFLAFFLFCFYVHEQDTRFAWSYYLRAKVLTRSPWHIYYYPFSFRYISFAFFILSTGTSNFTDRLIRHIQYTHIGNVKARTCIIFFFHPFFPFLHSQKFTIISNLVIFFCLFHRYRH